MLYIEGLTFADTADKKNISVAAIQKLLIAGIHKLVDMYNKLISK